MKYKEVTMSNNKQSSVEWLDEKLTILHFYYLTGKITNQEFNERKKVLMAEAKAMHKEEITEAFDEGQEYEYQYHINSTPKFDSETYYNETFGGNNEQQ